MQNKLSLLGILGLLGLLGFFTDNPGFLGFFGFFGFFSFAGIRPDEMFVHHVELSAKRAFFTMLLIYPAVIIIGALTSFTPAYAAGFAVSHAVGLIVFSISLAVCERAGKEG